MTHRPKPGDIEITQISGWHDPARTRWLVYPDEYRTGVATTTRRQAERKVSYSGLDYVALALHRFHVPALGLRAYIESSGHRSAPSSPITARPRAAGVRSPMGGGRATSPRARATGYGFSSSTRPVNRIGGLNHGEG